ncbi:MAG: peptide-methionine (R)-S-oxide reductase, partial [Maribacter sp.]
MEELKKNKKKGKVMMITWKDVIDFSVSGNPVPDKRVEKTENEWAALLTPEQFRITRKKGTEAPHSGALCSAHDAGKYECICCSTPLFDSTIKFESGTGWPSFTQPITENAIKYFKDSSFGMVRVEVLCNT